MKSVFISLIDFNSRENIIDCLNSVFKPKHDSFNLSIVVLNNYPKKLILPKFPNLQIKIIENNTNLGFAGGHNVGIKYALEEGADSVVILNNDTILDEDLISQLFESSGDNVGIVVPKIYFAKGYEFHKDRYKDKDLGKGIYG